MRKQLTHFQQELKLQISPKKILKKESPTVWDIERAHYEADLLLDENYDSEFIKNQALFKRKKIGIIKFHLHFMEGIDWLFLVLAIIGGIGAYKLGDK